MPRKFWERAEILVLEAEECVSTNRHPDLKSESYKGPQGGRREVSFRLPELWKQRQWEPVKRISKGAKVCGGVKHLGNWHTWMRAQV